MKAILESDLIYYYYIVPGNTPNSKQSKGASFPGLLDLEEGAKILPFVGNY